MMLTLGWRKMTYWDVVPKNFGNESIDRDLYPFYSFASMICFLRYFSTQALPPQT